MFIIKAIQKIKTKNVSEIKYEKDHNATIKVVKW